MVEVRPHRLYAKGRITGHTRGKRNAKEHTTLVEVEGARTKTDTEFYMGKRIAFVYKAKRVIDGSRIRVIWGRITRPHGNGGVVRAKFNTNIPPKAFGASVRIVSLLVNILDALSFQSLNNKELWNIFMCTVFCKF